MSKMLPVEYRLIDGILYYVIPENDCACSACTEEDDS